MREQKTSARRAAVIAASLAGLIVAGVPAVQAIEPPAPASASWTGDSTMVGGTSQVDDGEWIYQDFVYDDYGANTGSGSSNVVSLASTTGDFRYPSGARFAGNAADIVEVRAQRVGDDLGVRVSLNTIIDATVPAIGIAIDTGSGAVQAWPAGAGVTSTWDHFVTVGGGAATLVTPSGDVGLPATIDIDANTIDLLIPGLGTSDPSLVVGAGLWDATTSQWMAGSPAGALPGTFNSLTVSLVRVFDLAFNSHDLEPRKANWMEDAQAEALTFGDVDEFRQDVDLSGIDRAFQFTPGRYYNGLFTSAMDLGEGIGGSFPQYRGSLQPYGLWVPDSYDPNGPPTPLMFLLHSLSSHHNQYAGGATTESYATFYEQLLDGLGAIAATPLDRGPDGWYRNEGLVDALEVLDDVTTRFRIDEDRTWITGYSMGGYGTYRIGTLLPDRFAGAVSWAGVPTDRDRLDNMMWVPTEIIHGTNDELVPISGVRAQADRFEELGHEYTFFEHPGQDHLSFVFMESWTREVDWLGPRTRAVNPPTVSLSVQPSMWTTNVSAERRAVLLGHLADLGADFTSAYWVHDVANRSGETAVVRATSLAQADRIQTATPYDGVSPDLEPSPYLIRGQDRTLSAAPVSNGLDVSLIEVSSAGFDVAAVGLDPTQCIELNVTTDGPSTVHLLGSFSSGAKVFGLPSGSGWSQSPDGISVDVAEGTSNVIVVPSRRGDLGCDDHSDLDLRPRKEAVRDALAAIGPGDVSEDDLERIGKALEDLEQSLAPELWVDDNHLDPKHGDKVLNEERHAVKDLLKVDADMSAYIAELVDIDHGLALVEIVEAGAIIDGWSGDPEEIDKASDYLADAIEHLLEGNADRDDDDPERAIYEYRKAWDKAVKAKQKAADAGGN